MGKQQDDLGIQIITELQARRNARKGMLAFTQYTMPRYQTNWHHAVVASYLDKVASGEIRRLMIFQPPRHGKSEQVSRRYPAYRFGQDPTAQIMQTAYGTDLARRFNRDVQRIIDTPDYANLFPNSQMYGKANRASANGTYLRNSEIFEIMPQEAGGEVGSYRCAGVGSGLTGHGATDALIDDPVKSAKEAHSKVFRESVWQWYINDLYTRLEGLGRIILCMTRWHEDDPAGRLIKQMQDNPKADKWVVINFPAIMDRGLPHLCPEDKRKDGEPLWADKFPLEILERIRSTDAYRWSALYQGSPVTIGGEIINDTWFIYYDQMPTYQVRIVQSWDTAFKTGQKNDYSVCTTWLESHDGYYLIDLWRGKVEFPELKRIASMLYVKHKPSAVLVEDKASGQSLIQELRRVKIPIVAIGVDSDKSVRMHSVAPLFEAGMVKFPRNATWLADYIYEICAGTSAPHDDQIDSTTQALEYLRGSTVSDFDGFDLGDNVSSTYEGI